MSLSPGGEQAWAFLNGGLDSGQVVRTIHKRDRNGRIVWKKYGAIMPNDQELEKAIEKAL